MTLLVDAPSRTASGSLVFFLLVGIGSMVTRFQLARFGPGTSASSLVQLRLWRSRRNSDALQEVLYALGLEGSAVRGFESTGIQALGDPP